MMPNATRNKLKPARLSFTDLHPPPNDFYAEVIQGLNRRPRAIGPKFFYDEYGSRLFDALCRTPEYYPTRTEIAILERRIDNIAQHISPRCVLIEPGSGNSRKVRILLDTLRPRAYLPIDISKDYLRSTAQHVAQEYPWLSVHAVCADYSTSLALPDYPPGTQKLAFFPGSTIGNFEPEQAVAFLRNIARMVMPDGGLLIGVDLKKDPARLNAAYNDAQGITAAFNLNLLNRINKALHADFDLDMFRHHAFYNSDLGRIEMHLVSRQAQRVRVGNKHFDFAKGESIHTENSYKYSIAGFQALAQQAGFSPAAVWTDAEQLFSVHYLRAQGVQTKT
jgi:dimethylhistidine N-methyltransferase